MTLVKNIGLKNTSLIKNVGLLKQKGLLTAQAKIWYVRPVAGSYGVEDGTSYDNAWNGLTNIDWGLIKAGDSLWVCGTHAELLTIGASGNVNSPIKVRFDYTGDLGVIDSENTRDLGVDISNKHYVELYGLTSIDAVVSCLNIRGTSIVTTYNYTGTGSGNQGAQHLGTSTTIHNYITCDDNVDDGISGHDDSVIFVNGAILTNNTQGANVIASTHLTMIGDITFSGNATHDVYVTQADSSGSAWIDITGATIPVKAEVLDDGKLIMTDCTVPGALVASTVSAAILESSGCTYSGSVSFGVDASIDDTNSDYTGTLTVNDDAIISMDTCNVVPNIYASHLTAVDCVFDSIQFRLNGENTLTTCLIKTYGFHIYGTVTMNSCHILDNEEVYGTLNANYCLFNGVNSDDHLLDVVSGGTFNEKYSIFKGIVSAKFGIAFRTGSTGTVNGSTFVGASKVGSGMFIQVDLTPSNCIFTDLTTGLFRNAGTVVSDNNCFYDNTTDVSGTVTQNDSVTTDPKLLDVANNDFSLDTGSSCIGTGKDLGEILNTGIDTAVWGNGIDEVPVVTTKEQAVSWDIGAQIS